MAAARNPDRVWCYEGELSQNRRKPAVSRTVETSVEWFCSIFWHPNEFFHHEKV